MHYDWVDLDQQPAEMDEVIIFVLHKSVDRTAYPHICASGTVFFTSRRAIT